MKMEPFSKKVWLATPTMHGDEMKYVQQAYDTNWMSTVGENINVIEKMACEKTGCRQALLAGGVASSTLLREMLLARAKKRRLNCRLCFARPELSGDNAVGVALLGAQMLRNKEE